MHRVKRKKYIGPYAIIIFTDIHWFTSLKKQILDISIMTLISSYSRGTILNMKVKVTQLCLILWDCTVHGILQTRTLEWAAFLFPGDLPNPGIKPRSPTLQADSLPGEPPGKPMNTGVGSPSLLHRIFLTQELNWRETRTEINSFKKWRARGLLNAGVRGRLEAICIC